MNNVKNNVAVRLAMILLGAVLSLSAYAISDKQRAAIEARIQPVGEVCLEGDDSCGGPAIAVSSEPKSGEEVYTASCSACHASGVNKAPKFGDAAAWSDRISKGVDTLYSSAMNGFQGMPAKGLCMSCSDDELKAAVDYMVENSQ